MRTLLLWILGTALGPLALAQPAADVPVERVILFTSGVGYFEHGGRVAGDAEVTLQFDADALNDVLKSLLVEDPDGRVAGVVYPSQAPVERTLQAFAVDLSDGPDLAGILAQTRGAEVVVEHAARTVRGTILAVSAEPQGQPGARTLTVLTPTGLVTLPLFETRRIEFTDRALQDELAGALAALAEARGGQRRPVRVQFRGVRERRVRMGYVVESPVWKTTYRLVLPEAAGAPGRLQGWALVENPTEADWAGVDLTLVSGRPVSFQMDLYTPRYVDRPLLRLPDDAPVQPQTYTEGAAASSTSAATGGPARTITGRVVDARTGEALVGATVRIRETNAGASTGVDGSFRIPNVAEGEYSLTVSYAGYVAVEQAARVEAGSAGGAVLEAALAPSTVDEVTVSYERPTIQRDAIGAPRALTPAERRRLQRAPAPRPPPPPAAAPAPPPPPPPPPTLDPTAGFRTQATTTDFGELFAYRLGGVRLPRRASAMLPIVGADVEAERLSVFAGGAGRNPMRGVRLRNTTGANLRGGPITVLDDGYAGDALLPDLPAGAARLLTFAVDQDVLVDPFPLPDAPGTVETASLRDGVLTLQRQALTQTGVRVQNRGDRARAVLVELPRMPGAQLAAPARADETTPDLYRFRVDVAPGRADTLVVRQARVVGEQVVLAEAAPEALLALARADGALPEGLRAALAAAAERRRALAETERALVELDVRLADIERDQARIRGNLQSVDRRGDYARRLVRTLDEQETVLDGLRVQREALLARQFEQERALRTTVP